jgi:hypothetical protein
MSAAREPDQADFDLERFVDMFDEALTSKDPRVVNALRSLMMMVTLTRPESRDSGLHDRNSGPLRRLYEDMNNLNRRLYDMDEKINDIRMREQSARQVGYRYEQYPNEKYILAASQAMAAQIDQDVLNKILTSTSMQPKGLLKK